MRHVCVMAQGIVLRTLKHPHSLTRGSQTDVKLSELLGIGEAPMRIPAESGAARPVRRVLSLHARTPTDGRRLILQEQAFPILAALLERPGHLVTHDELRRRLWSSDTFVDFERMDQPRFIARHGLRIESYAQEPGSGSAQAAFALPESSATTRSEW